MLPTSATLKKRAPIWVWAIILLVVIIFVVIATLHFAGIMDFGFLPDSYVGLFGFGHESLTNAVLLGLGFAGFGALLTYFYIRYVKGTKVTGAIPSPYTPQGQTISTPPQQAGSDTVISQ